MCGIIGYIGFRDTEQILIEGLKKLEYRGYDSAGIAILDKKIQVYKDVGDVSHLEKNLPLFKGDLGIGHTRWATHGKVCKENAHPHICTCKKKIAVIHNGIIENFLALRQGLEKKGHKFYSQTDSEVIAHLIADEYKTNLEEAVLAATKKIKGAYAIVAVCEEDPDKLVGIRNESPLVIGVGDNENFLASDIPAFLKYTNRVMFLEDGELCILTKKTVKVFSRDKKLVHKKEELITWNSKDSEKSGFSHFMLKEIYDQPDAVHHALLGRISEIEETIILPESVEKLLFEDFNSIHIIACGTSYYAGLAGKYIFEQLTDIPIYVELASEYRYFGTKTGSSLVIGITQSGETADTLGALKNAKNSGCKTLVVTNVIGSTATRIADAYILTQSGPEVGVAATKTFTTQIIILLLIALKLGSIRRTIGSDLLYQYVRKLKELPQEIRRVIEQSDNIAMIAKKIKDAKSVFYIGRGMNYPLSLEGALKLKEISYIHAEGFAAGELKHGPFALLSKNTPVVALVSRNITYEKIISNIGEVKARGAPVIAIADDNDIEIERYADYVLRYPSHSGDFAFILIIVILQLFAFHVANFRGCPIDKPRNLAKSVTVE